VKHLLRGLFILFIATVVSSKVRAENDGPVIATIQQIPYSFINENGQEAGYLYEVAKRILHKAGFAQNVQMLPLKRMQKELQQGEVNFGILATTPYVLKHYDVVETIGLNLDAGILPRAGIKVSTYEDLQDLRIATPFGLKIDDRFDNDTSLSKFETKDYNQSTIILKRNRVDAIAGGIGSIRYNAKINGFDVDALFGEPMIFQDFPIALIKRKEFDDPELVEKLRHAIYRLRKTGMIRQIYQDFMTK